LPLYEYKCDKCGHRFEKIEKHSASEIKKCPKCGANAPRQVSAAGIQFKGSGWYVTDYAGKGSSSSSANEGDGASSKSEKSEKSEKSGKSESKSSETKASEKSSSEKSSSKKDNK
jgi:putative FmdB family regulatory protein